MININKWCCHNFGIRCLIIVTLNTLNHVIGIKMFGQVWKSDDK